MFIQGHVVTSILTHELIRHGGLSMVDVDARYVISRKDAYEGKRCINLTQDCSQSINVKAVNNVQPVQHIVLVLTRCVIKFRQPLRRRGYSTVLLTRIDSACRTC